MQNKTFSVLGYIMNGMNIKTSDMAQFLHIDTSLVSKWRTGKRPLNKNSVYFDDIIKFILDYDNDTSKSLIIKVLTDLFPHEEFSNKYTVEYHLRYALANENLKDISPTHQKIFGSVKTVPTIIFNENDGRREAVNKILDYADTIIEPAEIIFFDSEEFQWLWEDNTFSHSFVERINRLLKRNFHATFIIHYSSSKENFRNFFDLCSSILFNHNVDWFYCQYYDECVMNNSFIIINHAISMMGLSINRLNSSTMIFTDKNIVIQHEKMVENALQNYYPLFKNYEPFRVSEVIENIPRFKNKEYFLSFLPVPAFIGVDKELLRTILDTNNINNDIMENVLKLNYNFRKITGVHYSKSSEIEGYTVLIFQLEKMMERIYKKTFVSNSLSLCCGKEIIIQQKYYAIELRDLANELKSNNNLRIVLASEKDYISLPSINCWCMKNSYMLQMTKKGFRVCDESIVVNVASDALERCICRIPPERKEKDSVIKILLHLANELENN